MFLVFNKEKIYSYLIAFSMVALLFCFAASFINNNDTIQTSSNISKKLPIYSVQTEEKKVAFTMNCAW